MSTRCECTPSYTWLFDSDEMTLGRTSTPIPGGESCSSESFSSTTDKLLYHSWVNGLVRGSTRRRTRKSCEGDILDMLWDDNTSNSFNTGSGLQPTDLAGPAAAITGTKLPNVLAPLSPATAGGPGFENFPVNGVLPAGYAVGPGAAVFGILPGNELISAGFANCPPTGMNLVPGFLLVGANVAPVPSHASTGMYFPTVPAPAGIVPVPVGANYATAPGFVNSVVPTPVPIGVVATNGLAAVPTGANLVFGSVPTAANLPAHYDPYPVGLGYFNPSQVLVQPFYPPSCNAAPCCNFCLGCNPDGACALNPKGL